VGTLAPAGHIARTAAARQRTLQGQVAIDCAEIITAWCPHASQRTVGRATRRLGVGCANLWPPHHRFGMMQSALCSTNCSDHQWGLSRAAAERPAGYLNPGEW
jgi:hypothetical protein